MDTCFFEQVFIVVRTFAFGAYALRTLAFMNTSVYCRPYMCFLSSMHMLLVHVFHGHLLFGTGVFCRPCTCFYLYGGALFGELSLEKKCRTFGILSFISLLF